LEVTKREDKRIEIATNPGGFGLKQEFTVHLCGTARPKGVLFFITNRKSLMHRFGHPVIPDHQD